ELSPSPPPRQPGQAAGTRLPPDPLAPRPPVRARRHRRGDPAHPARRLPGSVGGDADAGAAPVAAAALVPTGRGPGAERVAGLRHGLGGDHRRRAGAVRGHAGARRRLEAPSPPALRPGDRAEPGHDHRAAPDVGGRADVRRVRPAAVHRPGPLRDHPRGGVPWPVRPGAALDRTALAGHAERLRPDHLLAPAAGQPAGWGEHARHRVLAAGLRGGAVPAGLRRGDAAGPRRPASAGPDDPAHGGQPGADLGRRGRRPQRGPVGDVRRRRAADDAQEPVRRRRGHRPGGLCEGQHRDLGAGHALGLPAGAEEGADALPRHRDPDGPRLRGLAADRLLPGPAQRRLRLRRLLGQPGLPVARRVYDRLPRQGGGGRDRLQRPDRDRLAALPDGAVDRRPRLAARRRPAPGPADHRRPHLVGAERRLAGDVDVHPQLVRPDRLDAAVGAGGEQAGPDHAAADHPAVPRLRPRPGDRRRAGAGLDGQPGPRHRVADHPVRRAAGHRVVVPAPGAAGAVPTSGRHPDLRRRGAAAGPGLEAAASQAGGRRWAAQAL
ncbi:MAG: hypothetical protein AVDCRST_MAG61-278, partial [uncultured Friedmanniella sp.]